MSMAGPRAAAFAIVGVALAAPAFAAGQTENAVQLYEGVNKACLLTVDLIANKKIGDAKTALPQLFALTTKMVELATQVQQNGAALAQPLGDAWTPTVAAVNELDGMVEAAAGLIGRGPVDPDNIREECAKGDTAIKASYAASQTFGKSYWALMNGPVENAKQLFDGGVSNAYELTVDYLEDENTDYGAEAARALHEAIQNLAELTYTALDDANDLARPLSDALQPADNAVKLLSIEAGALASEIPNSDFSGSFQQLQTYYADTNAAIVRAYSDVKSFGEKLNALCDTCR